MEEKKVLLHIDNLHVKFRVRGRVLTAIRGISLDIYENESIAIVGESGSGKSVFTKTFAGMLDSNGYVSEGKLIFNDEELADTVVKLNDNARKRIAKTKAYLDEHSKYEFGAKTYQKMLALESEKRQKSSLSDEERAKLDKEIKEVQTQRIELFNKKQTFDPSKEKDKIRQATADIKALDVKIKELEKAKEAKIKAHAKAMAADTAYLHQYDAQMAERKKTYEKEISAEISEETKARNEILAKEVYLSVGRYDVVHRIKLIHGLEKALARAMKMGVDLSDENARNAVFDEVAFRVRYLDETAERLHGVCILNLANVKYQNDWTQIRGTKIATVFQDPMTSLNPIITIGKQITSIIMKHQDCTEVEARKRAIELMKKVGIPNAEARYDD